MHAPHLKICVAKRSARHPYVAEQLPGTGGGREIDSGESRKGMQTAEAGEKGNEGSAGGEVNTPAGMVRPDRGNGARGTREWCSLTA